MQWRSYFKSDVLVKGLAYYRGNRVRELYQSGDIYWAKVQGRELYTVGIRAQGNTLISGGCSCSEGKAGEKCKHMAAVLFEMDVRGDKIERRDAGSSEKQVQPFAKEAKDPAAYQYFDMKRMTSNLQFREKDYLEAKKCVNNKTIVLEKVNIYGGTGSASGYYMDGALRRPLKLTFDRDHILTTQCDVFGCYTGSGYENYYSRRQICKHILGLMMLLDEYLKKNNPGDSTDREGEKVFEAFRKNQRNHIRKQQEQLEDFVLEPVLERNGSNIYLSFKAGTDKLYVVKNMTDFVEKYEAGEMIAMGTKTKIDSGRHHMSKSSKPIYEFLRRQVIGKRDRTEHARTNYRYYYEEEPLKGRMELFGELVDEVFDLFEGKKIAFTDKTGGRTTKSEIRFKTGKPKITAEIRKDVDSEQTFHGVQVNGEIPDMLSGGKYLYYFTGDSFCRLEEEMTEMIRPMLRVENSGRFSFTVGRNHLSEFYHQVLPIMQEFIEIKEIEPEAIEPYVPPKAKFTFYLDAENHNVMCKPVVAYGESENSLLDHLKKDVALDAYRNRMQEKDVLEQLYEWFPEVDLEEEELHCGNSEELILALLDGGVDRLMAYGEVQTTERFRNINIRKKLKLQMGVSVESDLMNLTISSDDIDREELLGILRNYRRKKKYYRLRSGEFVSVNEADIEMLSDMMETLQISPKEFVKDKISVPAYRALYLNKMLEQSEEVYVNRDKHFKNLIKEFKTVEDSEFEVPEHLKPVMRKYQVKGFRWLKTLEYYGFGGILADDMGLGKTLQMIAVLQSAKEQGNLKTALIVSPASLVYNWREEFRRFAPDLNVIPVVGTAKERKEIIRKAAEYDVLLTSYDLLKRDILEYEDITFSHQVLDEAQYIKNHGTAAAKTVKVIKSTHRFALTGTPIENRLSELWSIFDYLMPGYLYGYETFRKDLETPIVKYQEEDKSDRLKKMVAPFIMRRLKKDVLKDLPDKMEEIRYAKLDEKQQTLYDAQVVHMQQMLASQEEGEFQKSKLRLLAELTKIRQICCDPSLLFERYDGESAKRSACMDLIASAIEGEHKILVFSQFTSMLELLEKELKSRQISYYKITGETPKENRVQLVNAFNRDETPVFLISLKAGGTGLNLTGADVVIHYDPWWNQAAQNQATDRAHRIGQEKAVTVYKLIVKDTIEEKIVKMQESKKDLADKILNAENGSLSQMSKEELLELLGG